MNTIAELISSRASDEQTALLFDEQRWSYREFVEDCAQRAAYLLDVGRAGVAGKQTVSGDDRRALRGMAAQAHARAVRSRVARHRDVVQFERC